MADVADLENEVALAWPPPLHSEHLPSDADSGYEPSPAFTSGRSAFVFEWPSEEDPFASTAGSTDNAATASPVLRRRSAAIPIPTQAERRYAGLWNAGRRYAGFGNEASAVDVATQTSPDARSAPAMSETSDSVVIRLLGESAIPDLVPRIEEERLHRIPSHRLTWVLMGAQLRRLSDSFAADLRSGQTTSSERRRRRFPLQRFE